MPVARYYKPKRSRCSIALKSVNLGRVERPSQNRLPPINTTKRIINKPETSKLATKKHVIEPYWVLQGFGPAIKKGPSLR